MKFDISIIGYGVIGVESLYELTHKIKKKTKLNIAIIDKDLNNIPGGVAYSKIKSKFGFFNNPLRLSHPSFKQWLKDKKNIDRIIDFIKNNYDYKLDNWLSLNFNDLTKKNISGEIYFPRLAYSFYLEDKIRNTIKLSKKIKIKLFFLNGCVQNIEFKNDHLILNSKINFNFFSISLNKKSLYFNKSKKKIKQIRTTKIIVGNGLLPPKKIDFPNKKINSNYIWDFYTEGGTGNLVKKIDNLLKKKEKLSITFIGNKAGLLETMLYLKYLIFTKKYNIKINIVSSKFTTLNKAKYSNNSNPYKFNFFTEKNIKKINKAEHIINLLKMEFKNAILNRYNKYDVWTKILSNELLKISLDKLNYNETKKYNISVFPKIRNLTRFTYPEPIIAKEYLQRKKKIRMFKGRAKYIKTKLNKLIVTTNDNKKIFTDIVVNVSGPVNLEELNKEVPFINSIKQNINKFDKRGFMTNKNFMLTKQIYMPGILAYNFNPSRQTIIKAITNNSKKVIKFILKNLN